MGDATGREKNEAEETIEKAGKKVGNAISNSSVAKSVKKKIAAVIIGALGPVFLAVLIFAMGTIIMIGVVNFALAVKEGFINSVWSVFAQMSEYDEARLTAWNGAADPSDASKAIKPEDPDQTALIYQQLVSTNNAGEPLRLEKDGSNAVIDSLSTNSMWRDVMRNEQVMLAQDDMTYILRRAYDKNNEMFRWKNQSYTYEAWELKPFTSAIGGPQQFDLYKDSNKSTTTSNEDSIYDNLTREHIEGEEDKNGDKHFATHWQDAFALAYFYNMENREHWGESDENTYDPRDHGIDDKEVLDVNSTDGYYITDADLRMICDLFDYNFTYYWDAILSKEDKYYFQTYKNGGYTTGYRYRRIPDPEVDPAPPYASKDQYNRINQDPKNPYEYYSYPDHMVYDNKTLPFTQFTPESCPNLISNTIEKYKYKYTPIYPVKTVSSNAPEDSDEDHAPADETIEVPEETGKASLVHLDEAGETDYTPDPDTFQPPNGDYCIGRWHIVDPREFIDTMALLCPWYKQRSLGEDGKKWVERSGYNWVQEMIDLYKMYLELLPFTADHGVSRMDYYDHIAKLYTNKEILLYYEGTKYEGWEDDYKAIEDSLLHPDKDIYVAINIDGTLDESKDAQDTEKLRKGVIDAFKWMELHEIKYVILTSSIDLEKKKNWVQTEILSKLTDVSGYRGTYRVTRKDRYNYCHSHRIDVLVDDAPNVISTVSKYLPVIEVHCSDWDSQPSGDNIFEIDDFTEFQDALMAAASSFPDGKDYSDWKVTLNGTCDVCSHELEEGESLDSGTCKVFNPVNSCKDCFLNYKQEPKDYPFYSYGVTYHSKNDGHIGDDVDDNPGGGKLPDLPIGDPQGQVWITDTPAGKGGTYHAVNDWFYLYEGSDTPLDSGYYYSETEILTMLEYLEGRARKNGADIDFTSAVGDVYKFNQSTGADLAALFAIIIAEGGFHNSNGKYHYNFFDWTASAGEKYWKSSPGSKYKWWDAKAECGTVSRALVRGMEKTIEKYWGKGQNTYYLMCFDRYGYPQNHDEAEAAKSGFGHCYCPWWDDTGYVTTGYNSANSWCNVCAKYRAQFLGLIGK